MPVAAKRMRAGALGASLACTLVACGEEDHHYLARYEVSGLEVLSYDHPQLCRGLLDELEGENQRIAEAVGGNSNLPVQVLFGNAATERFCESDPEVTLGGCAFTDDGTIFAVGPAKVIAHELVHAHRQQVPGWRKAAFIEEGLADTLSIGLLAGLDTLSERAISLQAALELDLSEMDILRRRDASHFMFWIFEEFGQEEVVAAFSNQDVDAVGALTGLAGETLEEIRGDWHDSSEEHVRVSTTCDGAEVLSFDQQPVVFDVELLCDEPDVDGPRDVDGVATVSRLFCLDVQQTGVARLGVEVRGGDAQVVLIPSDPDCQGTSDFPGAGSEKYFDGEVDEDVEIAACRWAVRAQAELGAGVDVRIELTPSEG